MSVPAQTYTVRPIGFVRSPIDKPPDDCWGGLTSVIELDPQQFATDSTIGLAARRCSTSSLMCRNSAHANQCARWRGLAN
jgi:hypothetical protein